jgi:hypothetical protein
MANKGKIEGNRTLGALQFRQGAHKGNSMQSQRDGKRYNLVATSAKQIAEDDTKVALSKATKKKLEAQGTYSKSLKDGDYVEVNPVKLDMVGQGNNTNT